MPGQKLQELPCVPFIGFHGIRCQPTLVLERCEPFGARLLQIWTGGYKILFRHMLTNLVALNAPVCVQQVRKP